MAEDSQALFSHYQELIEQGKIYLETEDLSIIINDLRSNLLELSPSLHQFLFSSSKLLTTRKYLRFPPEVHLNANTFIQLLIKYCAVNLKKEYPDLTQVLIRIMNHDKQIYQSRYTDIPEVSQQEYISRLTIQTDSQSNDPIIEIISSKPNFLYSLNLHIFIQEQGFEKLVYLVTENISYALITKIMTFFSSFEEITNRSFWRRICKNLKDKLLNKIQNLSDEEVKNLPRQDIKRFFTMFDNYLQALYSRFKCSKILETAELNLAYRCLTSKYLEKRITGITDISQKITQVKEPPFRQDILKYLDQNFFISWIESHDLLEIIFGSSTHPELVKRSKDIVKFLYTNSRFDKNNIGKLWDCAMQKHETDRVALLSLFRDLCESFSLSDLQFLFSKVLNIDLHEIDSHTLGLVKVIALYMSNCISKSNDIEKIGWKEESKDNYQSIGQECSSYTEVLDFIWKLCQESSLTLGVSQAISKQAFTILKDILNTYNCKEDRYKFLLKCIENLKKNSSIITSYKLLEEVLSSYSDFRLNYDESRSTIIKNLDRDFHLLSELFTSFLLFKTEAVERIQLNMMGEKLEESREDVCYTCSSDDDSQESEERGKKHSELFKHLKLSSEFNFYEEAKFRLNFIKFVFVNSSETFQIKQIQVLWEAVVLNAVSEEEYELFFSWLSGCIDVWFMGGALVNEELTHFIFTDLFLKLDPRCISTEGYKCFEKLFVSLNKQHGIILSEFHSFLEVKDSNLLGIQYLWEIILKAKQKNVFRIAARFVHSLYKGIKQPGEVVVDDFLRTVLEFITDHLERIRGGGDLSTSVLRSVIVLTDFVQDFELRVENIEILVKNQIANTYPKSFKIIVGVNEVAKSLKNLVVAHINPQVSVSEIILFLGTKKIGFSLEKKLVKDLSIGPGSILNVYQASRDFGNNEENFIEIFENLKSIFPCFDEDIINHALETSKNSLEDAVNLLVSEDFISKFQEKSENNSTLAASKPAQNISEILSKSENYFNLLFSLFDLGNEQISNRVWKLLTRIPVNPLILSKIHSLSDDSWLSILSQTCPHKLLYGLNIIKDIFLSDQKEKWKEKFLKVGGLNHIYKVLMAPIKFSDKNKSFIVSLENLIRTAKVFISDYLIDPSRYSSVTLADLTNQMLEIIEECVNKELDSTSLIESALDFMVPLIVKSPLLLSEIYKRDSFNSLINYLLDSEKNKVRESIKFTILTLVESIPSPPSNLEAPVVYFLKVLLEKLPENSHNHCDEYFEVLVKLVQVRESSPDLLQKSLNTIESLLLNDCLTEKEESLLRGYLNLANTLLTAPSTPCAKLLTDLYTSLIAGHSKFQLETSKKTAFNFLLTLARTSQINNSALLQNLAAYHLPKSILKDHEDLQHLTGRTDLDFLNSNFDSEISGKSFSGFVGLRNFGATCYLNSLLQQLFMIQSFRAGVLECDLQVDDAEENLNENLLYQLKVVFWNLQESDKQYFEPMGFCKAFKDYDGQPLNVKQQQDVDEFFNMLHDKIEEILKPGKWRNLFKNCVCGTLVHEIESVEADFPYKSLSEETFYRISLDIKNKKTLNEALDLFVKEDILDGDNKYYCDQYDRKIPAKKRCLISGLSNTVIVHLKRFEFNYNTMQRTKINEFCEFPMVLDLKPWSDGSHQEDNYYIYNLVGVLVHSGNADAGHYYSIIKSQTSWFKFDDKYIEQFDLSHLKDECFGGESHHNWNYEEVSYAKTRNAYMLIYQRSETELEQPEEIQQNEGCFINPSDKIKQLILKENKEFNRDKFLFSSSYSEFLKEFVEVQVINDTNFLVKELSLTYEIHKKWEVFKAFSTCLQDFQGVSWTELESRSDTLEVVLKVNKDRRDMLFSIELESVIVKVATIYALEVLLRAKQSYGFVVWIKKLANFYKKNTSLAIWVLQFFTENTNVLMEVLVSSRDSDVRQEFKNFLAELLRTTSQAESSYLLETIQILSTQSSEPCGEDLDLFSQSYGSENEYFSTTSRFIKLYLGPLFTRAVSQKNMNEYLVLIKHLGMLGGDLTRILAHFSVISVLLLHFLSEFSHSAQLNLVFEKSLLVEIAANFIQKSMTQAMLAANTLPGRFIRTPYPIMIREDEELQLCSRKNIGKLVALGKHPDVLMILLHLAWENLESSRIAIEEFLGYLFEVKYEQNRFNACLKVGFFLCNLDDGVREERINMLFDLSVVRAGETGTFLYFLIKARNSSTMFFNSVLVWISDLMKNQNFLKVCKEKKQQFFEFLNLIIANRESGVYIWDYMDSSRPLGEELKKAQYKIRALFENEESEPENLNNNNNNTDLDLSQDSDTESC